ncbi:hypothetical protein L596_030581 [Steinernema carpocapsae]|uniref:Uncharacterized protein n=1 Tax=Steinernema carpocapsae TaxID=34508 RepID=A0A4U5LPT6_STECR|nr:hypothetical protein L596_030581 [Steinernema carpocapsae]
MNAWILLLVATSMVAASKSLYKNCNQYMCERIDYENEPQPWTSYGYEPAAPEGFKPNAEKRNWGIDAKKCFPPRHPKCRELRGEKIYW